MSSSSYKGTYDGKRLVVEPRNPHKHLSTLSRLEFENIALNMMILYGERGRERADDLQAPITEKQREWYRGLANVCYRNYNATSYLLYKIEEAEGIITDLLAKVKMLQNEEVRHATNFLESTKPLSKREWVYP